MKSVQKVLDFLSNVRIWSNVLSMDVSMVQDPPAVTHGGVRDQNRAHWADSHALVDDAVQVRQPTAIRHTHSTLGTHMFVQFLLHTFLHLKGVEQSGAKFDIKVRNGRKSYTSSLTSTSCPVDRTC